MSIRCGLIGLGRIGCLLEDDRLREKPCTHAGAIRHNPHCTLVAGCDLEADRRHAFAGRWNCPQVYAEVTDMLAEVELDILHVATPPDSHLDIVSMAAERVPVIVCEKPLAENSADADRLAQFSREGQVKILTNHERRYSKDYRRVKESIENGIYGPLLSVASRLYMGGRAPVVDILLNDGSHLVDIIHFLTDARLHNPHVTRAGEAGQETWFIGSCLKPSAGGSEQEIPVAIEVGSGRDHVVVELDLSFARGRIRVGNGLYEEFRSRPSRYYARMRSLVRTAARRPRKTGYFVNMLQDAVRCFQESDAIPVSSAEDGYRALVFIDAAREAARL